MSAESVGSVTSMNRRNNISNNAQSSIRRSGKKAGYTGKKLTIFVAAITATLLAMTSTPTLALGIKQQRMKYNRNVRAIDQRFALDNMKMNLQQKAALTNLRELAFEINSKSNTLTLKELNRARLVNKNAKNIASKAAASNAFRQVMNLPVKTVASVTGVSENALNVISKTSTNVKRTMAAGTETVAKGAENVGATTRIMTGSMKNTAKFLGPYAFVMTFIAIMAGPMTSVAVISGAIKMVTGMMSKGIPMTKSVVVKIFNMLYASPAATDNTPVPPSNRIVNLNNSRTSIRRTSSKNS
tara:strand:- start:1382 stop:2278 length:897 start_codon:yes stop_codon:yes gene_type:complete